MEHPEQNPEIKARINAAYYTAARLVHAACDAPSERAEREFDAAIDDLWTNDSAEDQERLALLVEALTEYGAVLARKAYGTRRNARDETYVTIWSVVPDEAAMRDLAAGKLAEADEVIARG